MYALNFMTVYLLFGVRMEKFSMQPSAMNVYQAFGGVSTNFVRTMQPSAMYALSNVWRRE